MSLKTQTIPGPPLSTTSGELSEQIAKVAARVAAACPEPQGDPSLGLRPISAAELIRCVRPFLGNN